MPSRRSSFKTLELTISALEQLVLNASDKSLLKDTPAASDAAREVERLIAHRVDPSVQGKNLGRGVACVDADFAFLAGMRSSNSGAPVRAVYGVGKQPKADEVEQIMEKLLSPSATKKKVQKKSK